MSPSDSNPFLPAWSGPSSAPLSFPELLPPAAICMPPARTTHTSPRGDQPYGREADCTIYDPVHGLAPVSGVNHAMGEPLSRSCRIEIRSFLAPRKGQHFRRRLAGKSGTAGALQPAFNRRGCSAPHAKSFQPASQLIHLPSGQLFNGVFNFTDAAHSWNLARDGRDRQDPKPSAAPSFQFRVVTADPDDNIFTDCAITAGADNLLTEDTHFAPLAEADYR